MSALKKPSTRWSIYLRDGLQCVYCGVTLQHLVQDQENNFFTLDHSVARSSGGSHEPSENLYTCCYHCNVAKGTMSIRQWSKEVGVNYSTLRSRLLVRRNRPLKEYRVAARALLGHFEGIPRADLVEQHNLIVQRQWASGTRLDEIDLELHQWAYESIPF